MKGPYLILQAQLDLNLIKKDLAHLRKPTRSHKVLRSSIKSLFIFVSDKFYSNIAKSFAIILSALYKF